MISAKYFFSTRNLIPYELYKEVLQYRVNFLIFDSKPYKIYMSCGYTTAQETMYTVYDLLGLLWLDNVRFHH